MEVYPELQRAQAMSYQHHTRQLTHHRYTMQLFFQIHISYYTKGMDQGLS